MALRFSIAIKCAILVLIALSPAGALRANAQNNCQALLAIVQNAQAQVTAADSAVRGWNYAVDEWQQQFENLRLKLLFLEATYDVQHPHTADVRDQLFDTMREAAQAYTAQLDAARRGQGALVQLVIWKAALASARQDYDQCMRSPVATTPPVAANSVCQVNRPLLKAGDNVHATMTVSSNHLCACGFERSDGWLALISAAENGTATAGANACTYQSRAGYKGMDAFTLERGWPEGGRAIVVFVVTVVD
jgi:hypothetical protein